MFPNTLSESNAWIISQRAGVARNDVNARRPYAYLHENEPDETGEIVSVNTIFLTNRECPWKCLMCDLWRNTLTESVAVGDIPEQMSWAVTQLPPARVVKLYNSGSFFDARAIPIEDYETIAELCANFERVIVESHPSLIGDNFYRLRELLGERGVKLEFAMGLESIHPIVNVRLNKNVSPEQFAHAAQTLRENHVDLRAFVLCGLPWLSRTDDETWTRKTIDFAFDCGAKVVAIIPLRDGNGAMETLKARGEWDEPTLQVLESAFDYGMSQKRGRVFADCWDLGRFSRCEQCFEAREKRLQSMNLSQQVLAPIECVCVERNATV